MSTIAERAARLADKIKDPDGQRLVIINYSIAAIEQRRVDIEKACDAYCNVVCQAEQTSGKRCYWRIQNERCQELESFVKAMEEEK